MITPAKLHWDYSQFVDADYSAHTGSCIKHQVYELTDIHQKFGGFPKSYCSANTMIHQLWWTPDQVDYAELGRQFNMQVITVSSIMQPPGCVIPYHRDTFYQIGQQYPDRKERRVRANMYLEDYRLGHMIQYVENDQIRTSVDWSAGDGFVWDSEILHLSANAGMQNKYTLQVSGFYIE